jgi:lipopolysaccharide export LptBFGC system permease protein LptF
LKAEICWLFAFVVRQQILVALGNAQSFSMEFVLVTIVLIFGTVGVYLLRAYLAR